MNAMKQIGGETIREKRKDDTGKHDIERKSRDEAALTGGLTRG
jgi:hypothetical protein